MESEQSADDMTFRVSGQARAQIFSLDPVPRIIEADAWNTISVGLRQRALALNAFLVDVYGAQQIIADGVIRARSSTGPPVTERRVGTARAAVRTHICGTDLVSTGPVTDGPRRQSAGAVGHRVRDDQSAADGPLSGRTHPARRSLPVEEMPQMIAETLPRPSRRGPTEPSGRC